MIENDMINTQKENKLRKAKEKIKMRRRLTKNTTNKISKVCFAAKNYLIEKGSKVGSSDV